MGLGASGLLLVLETLGPMPVNCILLVIILMRKGTLFTGNSKSCHASHHHLQCQQHTFWEFLPWSCTAMIVCLASLMLLGDNMGGAQLFTPYQLHLTASSSSLQPSQDVHWVNKQSIGLQSIYKASTFLDCCWLKRLVLHCSLCM